MTNDQQLLEQLLSKEILSDSDKEWLLHYLSNTATGELRELLLLRFRNDLAADTRIDASVSEQIWQQVSSQRNRNTAQTARVTLPAHLHPLKRARTWWAAAAIFLLLCAGAYLRLSRVTQGTGHGAGAPSSVAENIPAGRQGALLTLADGSLVQLDTIKNATIALEGGATARVINGELVYEGNGHELAYNTISTPKGRQYTVTLPDGTRVWLNSGSSIRCPVVFADAERLVKITGEAYLEVANNPTQPFRVNVNDRAVVTVLGTQFNVNAYDNEKYIATTLLTGSVHIADSRQAAANTVTLAPGQQAQLPANGATGPIKVLPNADVEQTVAWKNGLFSFEHASLAEIMRQLERWYDIEVVYENTQPDIALRGEITRDVPLAELLAALKKMGLQYKLDERRLIIGH